MSGAGARAARPENEDARARARVVHDGLDEGLFVEAGAGTGKTTQLVNRVVALVLERGIALREIAAITFTEAAASELRSRIREAFERHAVSAPVHDPTRLAAREALADADVAAISTLHGFAQRILSEHPVEVGIPPRVEVLDEVSSELEFDRRWRDFVDALLAEPANEELLTRAVLLGVKLESRFGASLRDVAVAFGESWDRLDGIAGETATLRSPDRRAALEAVRALRELPSRCTEPADDRLSRRVQELLPEVQAVEHALVEADDHTLFRVLRARSTWRHGGLGRQQCWPDVRAARDTVAAADEACAGIVADAADAVLRALATHIARFTIAAAEERRRAGRLEFHDLLVLARRLLRTSETARRALHRRYRRLLLDEFQDTDPIQVELAVLIAAVAANDAHDANMTDDEVSWADIPVDAARLFFVGDPKQSIYRFRRADIGLFLAARDRFAGTDPVRLTRSFRAVPTVIGWVNHVFAEVMREEEPGAQPRYEPLLADRAEGDGDHRVVLVGGPHDRDEGLDAAGLRELEAHDVAGVIGDILARPQRWPVLDRASGSWRAARAGDVTILLPARTALAGIQAALESRGVPYRTDTGPLVYETQEVRDLLSTVQAIVDPTDQIALVAALRSPAFGCSDPELLQFRAAGGRFDLRRRPPEALGAEHPVVAALGYLAELHQARWWVEPSGLVERIVRERRMLELAFAHRRPRDVWRRLRYVLDQARLFGETQGGDLVDFLAWATLQRRDTSRVHEPLLSETDDESVRIMTIHGAKGLEFPITVLAGTTTRFGRGRRGAGVQWGPDGAVEVRLHASLATERFDRLADLEAEMDEHEKKRLLYVAVTRARDHLVVATHHHAEARSFGAMVWSSSQPVLGSLCRSFGATDRERLVAPGPAATAPDADDTPETRRAWAESRAALLEPQRRARSVSATELARADRYPATRGAERAERRNDDLAADEPVDPGRFQWRRGRAATAVGRAVHAVLQDVDLSTGDGVEALAAVHCRLEGIPERVATVVTLVRSALGARVVRAAAEGDAWREAYVAAPVGDRIVEGYVDLLLRTEAGLVVVDYKTDAVRDAAETDERVSAYRFQGAAYALALEAATGLPVVECVFVFAHADGPIERAVPALREAMDALEARLTAPATTPRPV